VALPRDGHVVGEIGQLPAPQRQVKDPRAPGAARECTAMA
jgi:hypothetical protein